MKITAGATATRVDYRLKGKSYSHQHPEGRAPENTATNSDFPFDSADLGPGETLELPDGTEIVRVVELTPGVAPAADPTYPG